MKTEISKASARLDALDDQLADFITKIETGLRAHFSTRVHTLFNDSTRLVFGKYRGQWMLMLSSLDARNTTALLQASRELRQEVLSGGHIERLIREGAEQIESMIGEREHAIKEAERILLALQGTKP